MKNRRIIRDMHCVSNQLTRQLDKILSSQGVTNIQFAVLNYIKCYTDEGKDVFQKNLEYDFCIRPSSVSSVLSLLEEKNLVKRVSVKKDARLRKIILTPEGEKKQSEVIEKVDMYENTLYSLIPQKELDIFFSILDKLYYYAKEQEENL